MKYFKNYVDLRKPVTEILSLVMRGTKKLKKIAQTSFLVRNLFESENSGSFF